MRLKEHRKENRSLMEQVSQDEELKAHLLSSNELFRSLSEQHAHLKHRIEAIESKPHVTGEDELEEQRQTRKRQLTSPKRPGDACRLLARYAGRIQAGRARRASGNNRFFNKNNGRSKKCHERAAKPNVSR
jgi:hypothetical protein